MRILIVDDDEHQARLLARVIALNDEEASVSFAVGGEAALQVLKDTRTDLVLTDLQMPGVSGLDLVQWLAEHQPDVTVFAMTAYPDDAALVQLEEFGTVECFTKPLDVPGLVGRLNQALSDGMRGRIRNISLPSLLQLVDMEKKTCTLVVGSEARQGYLYFRDGVLCDARNGSQRGDDAAIEVVSWPRPHITILSTCASKRTTVHKPVGFIIMDSVRLQDESARDAEESQRSAAVAAPVRPNDDDVKQPTLSQFPAPALDTAGAMAVVAREDGRILMTSGEFADMEVMARLIATIFAVQSATAEQMGDTDGVEEVVLTAGKYWVVGRPLALPADTLAISIFDPALATVVMERLQLNGLAVALSEWSKRERSDSTPNRR